MNEAPIQNLDSFDIVGERNDGGVDLVVVCSGPLDDSADTQALLKEKIQNYLDAAVHPNLPNVYPAAKEGPVRIVVACQHEISSVSQRTIDELVGKGGAMGVTVIVNRSAV